MWSNYYLGSTKLVLQTAPVLNTRGPDIWGMFLCSQGCSYWVEQKRNKWLSKLKHNHPLFILSPFLSHAAYCKRAPNVQGSHDSEEHDVSSDEEQRPNEMCNCWTSKKVSAHKGKETNLQWSNKRNKRCWHMLLFLHHFTRKYGSPFTSTMNNWIVVTLEDQKCNRQHYISGRAWRHIQRL